MMGAWPSIAYDYRINAFPEIVIFAPKNKNFPLSLSKFGRRFEDYKLIVESLVSGELEKWKPPASGDNQLAIDFDDVYANFFEIDV